MCIFLQYPIPSALGIIAAASLLYILWKSVSMWM
jgi:hypothetical protein